MNSSPQVTFIVPALNAASTILRTLESISSQLVANLSTEIIVVDNGSTDTTSKIAQAFGAKVIYEPKRNRARARNIGAANARGEILCFVDSDTTLGPGWLQRGSEVLREYPGVGAWQSLIVFEDKFGQEQGRFLRDNFFIFSKLDSCALAMRKVDFDRMGGFDPWLKRSEDTDLSCRFYSLGWDLYFDDSAYARTAVRKRWALSTFWENGFGFGQLLYKWRGYLEQSLFEVVISHFQEWRALGDGVGRPVTWHSIVQACLSGVTSLCALFSSEVLRSSPQVERISNSRLGWSTWSGNAKEENFVGDIRISYFPESALLISLIQKRAYCINGIISDIFREAARFNRGLTTTLIKDRATHSGTSESEIQKELTEIIEEFRAARFIE